MITCDRIRHHLIACLLSYDEFIDSSSQLNELKNYPQLMERSGTIGYEVTKIVFRGYHAGDKLQVY